MTWNWKIRREKINKILRIMTTISCVLAFGLGAIFHTTDRGKIYHCRITYIHYYGTDYSFETREYADYFFLAEMFFEFTYPKYLVESHNYIRRNRYQFNDNCGKLGREIIKHTDGSKTSMTSEIFSVDPVVIGLRGGLIALFLVGFLGSIFIFLIYSLERLVWTVYVNRSEIIKQGTNSIKSAVGAGKATANKTKKWVKSGFDEESEKPD